MIVTFKKRNKSYEFCTTHLKLIIYMNENKRFLRSKLQLTLNHVASNGEENVHI